PTYAPPIASPPLVPPRHPFLHLMLFDTPPSDEGALASEYVVERGCVEILLLGSLDGTDWRNYQLAHQQVPPAEVDWTLKGVDAVNSDMAAHIYAQATGGGRLAAKQVFVMSRAFPPTR